MINTSYSQPPRSSANDRPGVARANEEALTHGAYKKAFPTGFEIANLKNVSGIEPDVLKKFMKLEHNVHVITQTAEILSSASTPNSKLLLTPFGDVPGGFVAQSQNLHIHWALKFKGLKITHPKMPTITNQPGCARFQSDINSFFKALNEIEKIYQQLFSNKDDFRACAYKYPPCFSKIRDHAYVYGLRSYQEVFFESLIDVFK